MIARVNDEAKLSVLDALFDGAASDLRDGHWAHAEHRVHHGSPDRFGALFDVARIADVQSLVRRHVGNITGSLRAPDGTVRDLHHLTADDALHLYDCGATLHVDTIHGHDLDAGAFGAAGAYGLGAMCGALARELGLAPDLLRTVAFAARRPGPGSPVHADNKDIFVVHVGGAKKWTIGPNRDVDRAVDNVWPWSPKGPTGLRRSARPAIDVELRPGSVLFLPRGHWHATEVTGEDCVALTIGFERPPWARVVATALYNILLESGDFREPIGSAWGDAAQRAEVERRAEAVRAALLQRIAELPPSALIDMAFAETAPTYERVRTTRVILHRDGDARWIAEILSPLCRSELEVDEPEVHRMLTWIASRDAPFSAADLGGAADVRDASAVAGLLEELTALGVVDRAPILGRRRSAFFG